MDSPVSPKDEIWFLCVCHHISDTVYNGCLFCLQVGDRVVALPEYRAWAELVAVPARYVYNIPADLSYLDAAAIAMNYLVAYILLFELGGLAPGKSVLVHSAGGGVVSISQCKLCVHWCCRHNSGGWRCCSSSFRSTSERFVFVNGLEGNRA
jgi:NADPH-dependent curcumin reductase CurA